MRIQSSHYSLQPISNQTDSGNGTLIFAIGIATCVIVVLSAALVCLINRRRKNSEHHTTLLLKKSPSLKDGSFNLKKPTAVKSPQSACPGPTLKKSPSPTEQKSPPGSKSKDQESPSNCEKISLIGSTIPVKESLCNNLKKLSNSITDKVFVKTSEMKKSENRVNCQQQNNKNLIDYDRNQLGELHFRLKYNYEKQALSVTITKCTDLKFNRDKNQDLDPYVKLQLILNRHHKVKTRVLRKTRNPVYDEDFVFYEVTPEMMTSTALHFVILSFDRCSRDDVIGEVYYQMGNLSFDTLEKQISLVEDILPRNLKIRSQGRGEILISLCYQPAANRLTVVVLKARNLPKIDVTGLCDPFVKIYLLLNNQRIGKKKTHVKKHTSDPVFNESFIFDIPSGENLDNISLQFQVLDYDRETKNEVIGTLHIGENACLIAQKHWLKVSASPRRQIAEWHKLKE